MIAQIKPQNNHKFRSNIEAEEAILGGILLDPNAIKRIEKILQPEAFAVTAHQIIYRACLTLHQRDEKVDLMTVTVYLDTINQLDVVGGQMKLAQLVDRTVSAVNVDQYALLVISEYLSRRLSRAGYEIVEMAENSRGPADILQAAEDKITNITRSYKSGIFERESSIRFRQISKHLERIEDENDDNPALKEWELRELASEYNFRSVRDLLNFHAKWLQSRKSKRSVGLQEFWETNNQPNQWIMRGFIPRKSLNILWGSGGVGKTLLTGSLCKKLISGEAWADYPVEEPAEVLLVETDQGKNITAMQLDTQGFLDLNVEEKSRFRILSEWNIEEFGVLRRELSEIREKSKSPIMVVIDSLTSVSKESTYSENDIQYARPLERLRDIAERFDCSFLILHHGSKLGQMRGTTAIHNSADQVFKLKRTDKKENGIAMNANLEIEKSRYRLEGTYRLRYQPDERIWEMQGRVTNVEGIEGSEEKIESSSQAFRLIYRFLEKNRGVRYQVKEIVEAVQLSDTTVRSEISWGMGEGLIDSARSTSTERGGRRSMLFFVSVVFTAEGGKTTKTPYSKDLNSVEEGENQFSQFSHQKSFSETENEKKFTVKTGKTGKTTETPHSKDSSDSVFTVEGGKTTETPHSKGLRSFFEENSGIKNNNKDYCELKSGDLVVRDSSIIQITRKVAGNCWELSKNGEYISLADWRDGIVRPATAEDIALAIEENPSREWFQWLHKNAQSLQAEAMLLIQDEKLLDQCYEWLNPPSLTERAIAALEYLRKSLIANPDKKVSRQKFIKDWGIDGEIAIENAVSDGTAKLTANYIVSLV
jgi:replicative DNA helicase